MNCPLDNTTLAMVERQGVEIDYCPTCRGVWLDRGELDKIIDRSVPGAAQPMQQPVQQQAQQVRHDPYQGQHQPQGWGNSHPSHGYPHHKKKKREGFLGELFDFD